jgi:nucleoside-diphosphate-sugar epimerase
MQIFITGGSGCIGCSTIRAQTKHGIGVTARSHAATTQRAPWP